MYDEYYTEHYMPLVENNAVVVARNWNEFLTLLTEAIAFPQKYEEGRQRAVQEICGTVDGNSTGRLVSLVLGQLTLTRQP